MNIRIPLAALAFASFALAPLTVPVSALAATHYSYSSAFQHDAAGYTGSLGGHYSSAIQKAINKLDKGPVEDLPIPVLFIQKSTITPNFGDPRDGGTRTHMGEDILAPRDSFIVSPTDAVVTRIGTQSSEGNYVNVAAPGGETFIFMHLDHFADIDEGDVLKPGDIIGYVGNTGNAAGGPTHLHFEVHDKTRKAIDPYPLLTGSFSQQELISSLTSVIKDLKRELADAK